MIEVCSLFKNAFLQQSAFDDVDRYSTIEKQLKMLTIIMTYWRRGQAAIKRGVTLVKLKRLKAVQEIVKMKFTVPNESIDEFDRILARLERGIDQLEAVYA